MRLGADRHEKCFLPSSSYNHSKDDNKPSQGLYCCGMESVTATLCTIFICLLSLIYLFFLSVSYGFPDIYKSIYSLRWESSALLSLDCTHWQLILLLNYVFKKSHTEKRQIIKLGSQTWKLLPIYHLPVHKKQNGSMDDCSCQALWNREIISNLNLSFVR